MQPLGEPRPLPPLRMPLSTEQGLHKFMGSHVLKSKILILNIFLYQFPSLYCAIRDHKLRQTGTANALVDVHHVQAKCFCYN